MKECLVSTIPMKIEIDYLCAAIRKNFTSLYLEEHIFRYCVMTYIMIETDKLTLLAEQISAVKRAIRERVEKLQSNPNQILTQEEALAFLGISKSKLKRLRYDGQIQYHQADDKIWFYQWELELCRQIIQT